MASANPEILSPSEAELVGTTRDQLTKDEAVLDALFATAPNIAVFTQSNSQYDSVRRFFNSKFTQKPLAVIRPKSAQEVAAVLKFSATHNVPFGVRNRGHDLAGRAPADGGIMIDLRALDAITLSQDRTFVRVGGGALSSQVLQVLHPEGLVTPTGWCNGVGYPGWALGGGYGILSSKFGLGVDQILGATVALADGSIVDTDEHPDLLWALRGAGNGTLGVAVELRVKVYPSPKLLAGILAYGWEEVEEVLGKFSEIQNDFPDDFTGEVMTTEMPGIGPCLSVFFAWIASEDGDLAHGHEFLEKFKTIGTPLLNTVSETDMRGFTESIPLFPPSEWALRACSIVGYSQKVAAVIAKFPPHGQNALVMHNAHGAAIRPNPDACFPIRKRHRTVHIVGNLDTTTNKGWMHEAIQAFRDAAVTIPESYGNLTPPEDFDVIATYGEETIARLKEIKKRYDGGNIFSRGYPSLI